MISEWGKGGGVGFKRLLTASRHSSLAAGAPGGRPSSGNQASYYGDFLRKQMRGLLDLLRQNQTSMFILFEWSPISMASLTMRSMYRVLVARMEVSWNRMQLRLTCLDVLVWCVVDAPINWCLQKGLIAQCRPCRINRGSRTHLES
jgi:hypothetical protein